MLQARVCVCVCGHVDRSLKLNVWLHKITFFMGAGGGVFLPTALNLSEGLLSYELPAVVFVELVTLVPSQTGLALFKTRRRESLRSIFWRSHFFFLLQV